jgi:tetratricopeptide (TPR) repeat protein
MSRHPKMKQPPEADAGPSPPRESTSADRPTPDPERAGSSPPRMVLAIAGTVFAIILAVAFYYSPMHFGLDRIRAQWAFDAGAARDKDKSFALAIERYTEAIALNPELTQAYNNRALDRRRTGDLDGAIADYGEVIRRWPDAETGYYNRALVWRMKGDDDAALSDFAAAISRGRAQLQRLQQNHDGEKFARLRGILQAQEYLRDAYLAHARLHVENGHYGQAIASLDDAIAVAGDAWPTEAYFERARVLLLHGQFAAAAAEFDRFAAKDVGYTSGALMYRGFLALFQANDPKAAAEHFKRALQEGVYQIGTLRGLLDGGAWLSNGVPLVPNVHHLILWQHVARERLGQGDREELNENLKQLAGKLGYSSSSSESLAKSRTSWPGPVIDMVLRTRTPEAVRAAAEASTDPKVRRRQVCDADFYTGLLRLKAAPA